MTLGTTIARLGAGALVAAAAFGTACSDYAFEEVPPANDGVDTGGLGVDTGGPDGGQVDGDTGAIKGRVCDFSGDGWVVGASVVVTWDLDGDGVDDGSASATTDLEGWFQLNGVPLGEHTVVVQKGSFSVTIDVALLEPGLLELAEEECLAQDDVKIAVITGQFDHIESILAAMELEFDVYDGVSYGGDYIDLLLEPEDLGEYDIVFFNCGIEPSWDAWQADIGANLRAFVDGGGSVYASDWAYYFFESAWPEMIDFYGDDAVHIDPEWGGPPPAVGLAGRVTADIFDPNMMAVVGSNRADLSYDLDAWVVPVSTLSSAQVMVRGDIDNYHEGRVEDAPLAIKVVRGGTAIFTTFHNERQITIDMERLLEEIILNL